MRKKVRYNKGDLSNKRRRRRDSKIFVYIFSVLIISLGLILLFRIPALRIKSVEVSGTKDISAEKIKNSATPLLSGNYFFIFPKNSSLFYSKSEIANALLATFPRIESVNVASSVGGVLSVNVVEKKAVALWCGESCYLMDSSGDIFAPAENVPYPGFVTYKGLLSGNPMGQKFPIIPKLQSNIKDLGLNVSTVNFASPTSAEVKLEEGFVIKFIPEDSNFLEYFKLFIANMKSKNVGVLPNFEYIDARYSNKIFYKLR